jgi:hypothetical protein
MVEEANGGGRTVAAQLNIKDAEIVRKVRELAARRGQPVTTLVRALVDSEWQRGEQADRERDAWLRAVQERVRRATPPETAGMSIKAIMDSIYEDDDR